MADRHMEDWISAFEAFGVLETVRDLAADPRPAWIFSRDGRSVHWANPAGGAMFDARRFADMAGRTARQADPFVRQLANVARSLGEGGSLARLRLPSGARAVPLLCQCRPVRTADGQRGIFVIAMDATQDLPVSEEAAAAFVSGIKSAPAGTTQAARPVETQPTPDVDASPIADDISEIESAPLPSREDEPVRFSQALLADDGPPSESEHDVAVAQCKSNRRPRLRR